jgi:catalase
MTDEDRAHLCGNIVDHLKNAQLRIQKRQTALFFKADPDYGRKVAQGLGLDTAEIEKLAAMTQEERVGPPPPDR